MKRNTIYAFLVTLALVFSGCGSNSLEDATGGSGNAGTTPTGQITTTLQDLTIDKNTRSIVASVALTSTYASTVEATLSSMDIVLGGCTLQSDSLSVNPNTVTLDSNASTQNVSLSGILTDAECVPSSYQVTGTNNILENSIVVTEDFATNVAAIDAADVTIEDSSQITLNVVTKQLDINDSGIDKNITITVLKGQVGEANQNVVITNISSIVGSFSSTIATSDASGDAVFSYTAPTPMVDNNFTVEFCLEENSSICDTATINLTTSVLVATEEPIDNINYFITFVPNNGVNNLELGARNNAIVTLVDKDTNEAISSDRIASIRVTSRDSSILKLTPEGGGTPKTTISFTEDRNAVPVLLTADEYNSGLAVIEVIIEYTNLNGVSKTRGQLFTVAVLSGEPTAFSINDDGVSYNFDTKQFEHKFIVQATDASSNPIATTGYINVSAMASFAKDATGREMLYGRFANQDEGISATLSSNSGTGMLELNGGLSPFDTINKNRAFVAVFSALGTVDTYEANGKWNIDDIVSGNALAFSNEYNGATYANLGMAVGYNYRDKICTSAYEESVVVVDSTDGTYLLDENGQAVVTLNHDAYMIGKRAMILVNMAGLNPSTGEVQRSGEVHEVTLSHSLELKGDSFPIPKNAVNWTITLGGLIDTGTEDEYAVINSTFHCTVKSDDGITGISSVIKNIPSSCAYGGVAFISYDVNASADGGTVTLEKCQVDNEVKF